MPDRVSTAVRSRNMSAIRSRENRTTELALIRHFRALRVAGWRRGSRIFGRPDFVFPAERLALFVDGCFWHGCPQHATMPEANRAYWESKRARNCARDRLVNRSLRRLGWRVLRVWEHELADARRVVQRVRAALNRRQSDAHTRERAAVRVAAEPHCRSASRHSSRTLPIRTNQETLAAARLRAP